MYIRSSVSLETGIGRLGMGILMPVRPENWTSKWMYWSQLPHAMYSVWPPDDKSQEFAVWVLLLWDDLVAKNDPKLIDRHTYRLLSPECPRTFRMHFIQLANDGVWHPRLKDEMEELNQIYTHEQPGEELHARVFRIHRRGAGATRPRW